MHHVVQRAASNTSSSSIYPDGYSYYCCKSIPKDFVRVLRSTVLPYIILVGILFYDTPAHTPVVVPILVAVRRAACRFSCIRSIHCDQFVGYVCPAVTAVVVEESQSSSTRMLPTAVLVGVAVL